MQIAFIGTGVMGQGMVRNLLKNNFSVGVFNRTYAKAKVLEADGAVVYSNLSTCIEDADVIITMLGYPIDVQNTYKKVIPSARKNALLIDMTTSSPILAQNLTVQAELADLRMLDAPVSGGDVGARNGKLTIMVGGKEKDYESALPLFQAMGETITYIGQAGSGQHCKMANQIAIAGAIAGVMESLAYVKKNNLPLEPVLNAISGGSAASFQLDYCSKKIMAQNYAPGFFVKHFIKDMQIAQTCALKNQLVLPILQQVLREFKTLAKLGLSDEGTQALYKYYIES